MLPFIAKVEVLGFIRKEQNRAEVAKISGRNEFFMKLGRRGKKTLLVFHALMLVFLSRFKTAKL